MSRMGKIFYLISGLSLVGFVVARFLIGGFVPALWGPLGLFVVGIIAALIVDRRLYFDFLSMKTTKHGMNMGMMILMVLVLLAVLNYLGVKYYKTFDFSLAQVNTLSDQSIKLVKALDSELKVTFFYKEGAEGTRENRAAFQTLIKRYQDQSPKIILDFVEVNERPDLAEQYAVNKGGGVVFLEYKGRKSSIEKIDEQEITGALVKVTREKDKKVYVLTGHSEGNLEDSQDTQGLALLKSLLEKNRYSATSLALTEKPEVPADADVVIIAGPKQAFFEAEIVALENYLKRGGSVILAVDPKAGHGLEALLAKVGVKLESNYIVYVMQTMMGQVANPKETLAEQFSNSHPITKVFGKNQFTVFQLPQAITKSNVPTGITIDEIVKTGTSSFGFTDTKFDGNAVKGPFTVMAAVKGKWPGADAQASEFNLIVAGDSDFLGNQLLYKNLNRDLMLNAVSALAKEENQISITPKEVAATEMTLTDTNFYLFLYAFIIPLPFLLLVSSGWLWFRRRHA